MVSIYTCKLGDSAIIRICNYMYGLYNYMYFLFLCALFSLNISLSSHLDETLTKHKLLLLLLLLVCDRIWGGVSSCPG